MINNFMNAAISIACFVMAFWIATTPQMNVWDSMINGLIGMLVSGMGCLFAWVTFRQAQP